MYRPVHTKQTSAITAPRKVQGRIIGSELATTIEQNRAIMLTTHYTESYDAMIARGNSMLTTVESLTPDSGEHRLDTCYHGRILSITHYCLAVLTGMII